MFRIIIRSILLLLFSGIALIAAIDSKAPKPESPLANHNPLKAESLSYSDALILGLVEGVTEYLPISSTGHLILTNELLGLNSDSIVLNRSGEMITVEDKTNGGERPYTIGEAAFDYIIVIQAGAIAAVLLLYRHSIFQILIGCIGRSAKGRKLGLNLLVAFFPAAVLGLLLNDHIEALLGQNIAAVAAALIVGAIVMLIVERRRKQATKTGKMGSQVNCLSELSYRKAFMIGCFQCFAMWPGTSRSMATIVGAYLAGLPPALAAEFSFMLGLITLGAASSYTVIRDGHNMIEALPAGPVLLGCFIAFITSVLAIKWLITYITRHGLSIFAWYRIILAAIILLQFY